MDVDNNFLEELKTQLKDYAFKKEQAHVNYQQLIGAIFVIENLIKSVETKLGETNVETDIQSAE